MLMRAAVALLLSASAEGFVATRPFSTSRRTVRMCDGEMARTMNPVDVSPAAEAIQQELKPHNLVGKGVNADPTPLADGSIPINIKFDIRWFIFLSLFSIGEEPILEATRPIREISLFGLQPFDAIISSLAGPVVRSSDPATVGQGLHEVPTGGLFIVVAYFIHWKGWDADLMRAVRRQQQVYRDRDRV